METFGFCLLLLIASICVFVGFLTSLIYGYGLNSTLGDNNASSEARQIRFKFYRAVFWAMIISSIAFNTIPVLYGLFFNNTYSQMKFAGVLVITSFGLFAMLIYRLTVKPLFRRTDLTGTQAVLLLEFSKTHKAMMIAIALSLVSVLVALIVF